MIYLTKQRFVILSAVVLAFALVSMLTAFYLNSFLKDRIVTPKAQNQSDIESTDKTAHIPSPENVLANESDKSLAGQDSANGSNTSKPVAIYILKQYKDILGVFTPSTGKLIKTLDVSFISLPEFDREMLGRGIEIYSEDDLQMAIEDYVS